MDSSKSAPAGAPLAAHFEAKRRILATVQQMQERGEALQEASPEEVLEAADRAASTVFRFDFSLEDKDKQDEKCKKRSRNRKKHKKRKAKQPSEPVPAETESEPVADEPKAESKQKPTYLKLRKATGTESEVAKMHLRYGQGRRNMAAIRQRELRKKDEHHDATTSDFKFNFATS